MTKYINFLMTLILSVILSACGGAGGGGGTGGGNPTTPNGSADIGTFTGTNTSSNVCRNYSQPTDQTTCGNMGGTWNASRSVVTTSAGSYDETTYVMTCGAGTAAAKCTVSGIAFSSTAGLSNSSVYACTANGGTVSVLCTDSTGSEMVGNCTGVTAPNNSSDCSSLGGTFYTTLRRTTGTISNANIEVGTNTIQAFIDVGADDTDIMSLSPTTPVYFTYTIKIKDYGPTLFWQSAQVRDTSNTFESAGSAETFTVYSPVGTRSDSNGSIEIESATLFFY